MSEAARGEFYKFEVRPVMVHLITFKLTYLFSAESLFTFLPAGFGANFCLERVVLISFVRFTLELKRLV